MHADQNEPVIVVFGFVAAADLECHERLDGRQEVLLGRLEGHVVIQPQIRSRLQRGEIEPVTLRLYPNDSLRLD